MRNSYSKMFTLRKDGYYQKKINGKVLYDKDPEVLYQKWQDEIAPKKPTFVQAAKLYEDLARNRLQERTWKASYEPQYRALVAMFGDRPIDEITAGEIDAMFNLMKAQGFSKTIIHVRKTILNQVFNQAVIRSWIPWSTAAAIKLPRGLKSSVRHSPSEDAMTEILRHYEEPFDFLVFFLLCTGLRKSEALALTKNDVDLKNNRIEISRTLTYVSNSTPRVKEPKTEAGVRTVPIISILRPRLVGHMGRTDGDLLFPCPKSTRNRGGGYYTEKAFQGQMRNYCERYGVELTAHMLRHGTATLMFDAGVDVYTMKEILGHADIQTTMAVYTELQNRKKSESINRFDEAMGVYSGV